MSVATLPLDYATIKQRQRAVWSAGDYAMIGTTLQIVGERLCEAVDMRAGSTVLDVAAGNGNATLAALAALLASPPPTMLAHFLSGERNGPPPSAFPSTFRRLTPKRFHLLTAASTWRCPRSASCSPRTRRRQPTNSFA